METMTSQPGSPPVVTLLVGSGCSHCLGVLDAFGRLLKEGRVGRLEVINVTVHPEEARQRGARSVPWMEIGAFRLEGAHSYGELAAWVEKAGGDQDDKGYTQHLLETGRLDEAIAIAKESIDNRKGLLELLASADTPITVKIGIGAIVEELSEAGLLADILDDIVGLSRSESPHLRADACHFLGLTRSPAAIPRLREMLAQDENDDVREIAAESLAEIASRATSA